MFVKRKDDAIGLAMNHITDYSASTERHNIYYAYYDGAWKNIGGSAITIPISKTSADSECLAYNTGDIDTDLRTVIHDDSNTPYIQYRNNEAPLGNNILTREVGAWVNKFQDNYAAIINIHDSVLEMFKGYNNIGRYTSSDNGTTFDLDKYIISSTTYPLGTPPKIITNYNDDARLIFYGHASGDGNFYIYLWGDRGLKTWYSKKIKNSTLNNVDI